VQPQVVSWIPQLTIAYESMLARASSNKEMANLKQRLPGNVAGEFYVDSRCIDCDACRQIAPELFSEQGGYSVVQHQPETQEEIRRAMQAIVACPTGSIGTAHKEPVGRRRYSVAGVASEFPLQVEADVYYCGFNSPKSFGGNSYFVRHEDGNYLIDSPRYSNQLVTKFGQLGGIRFIFLSHSDDVADADKYAKYFGAERIIHREELRSQPDAEIVIEGEGPVELSRDFLVIPTPGHTPGHCCLLFRNQFLFTGDHLDWDRDRKRLDASRDYCWYSWRQQVESMAKLLDYSFEWVLPGHGQRVKLEHSTMKSELEALVQRMGQGRR
jgi:glyoxylase-like metal-dependent hydrolase (beta-lactamase superfamily II)/ferredoxin